MMTEGVAMYKTLSGKAWRNGMVAVVNAALERGHIGLEPPLHASSAGGSDRWLKTDDDYIKNKVFAFEVGGIPAVGALRRCTWALNEDELSVHVALWPTDHPLKTHPVRAAFGNGKSAYKAGEFMAVGFLERRKGRAWIYDNGVGRYALQCRRNRLATVAGLSVEPRRPSFWWVASRVSCLLSAFK
jgi:hypothetical protein